MLTIKKYQNRKLYDCDAKEYITLADVETMYRMGTSFQVLDYRTKLDLTKDTVIRALVERGLRNTDKVSLFKLTEAVYNG